MSGRTPLLPLLRVLILRMSILLTISTGTGYPTPTACDLMRLIWSCYLSSWLMETLAKEPNPVVTPYTTFLGSAIISSIAFLLLKTFSQAWLVRFILSLLEMILSSLLNVNEHPSNSTILGYSLINGVIYMAIQYNKHLLFTYHRSFVNVNLHS